ncbi:uncharacterized protein EV422DRAFT_521341 [Fimicolochytrium jonesii]|uniref:uncharacterized protein n=1 Tax=Fimicolochytrium jonesii TaxID=1396493 RepID=UPI0022FDC603|nr:uncharacterized protein EV422DRAFT_521341 [Fimicolochytrium jonesii]KAI8823536.1 hypothetical protein EV422DRAFT_521341 [Fimicolochytrium jonesii]
MRALRPMRPTPCSHLLLPVPHSFSRRPLVLPASLCAASRLISSTLILRSVSPKKAVKLRRKDATTDAYEQSAKQLKQNHGGRLEEHPSQTSSHQSEHNRQRQLSQLGQQGGTDQARPQPSPPQKGHNRQRQQPKQQAASPESLSGAIKRESLTQSYKIFKLLEQRGQLSGVPSQTFDTLMRLMREREHDYLPRMMQMAQSIRAAGTNLGEAGYGHMIQAFAVRARSGVRCDWVDLIMRELEADGMVTGRPLHLFLEATVQARDFERSLDLFKRIQALGDVQAKTYELMVVVYLRAKRTTEGINAMYEIAKIHNDQRVYGSFHSIFTTFMNNHEYEEAWHILTPYVASVEQFKGKKGLRFAYEMALQISCRMRDFHNAQKYWSSLESHSMRPNPEVVRVALEAAEKEETPSDSVKALITRLVKSSFLAKDDANFFRALRFLSKCHSGKEVLEAWKKIPTDKLKPDNKSLGGVFAAYAQKGDLESFESLQRHMEQNGVTADRLTLSRLLLCCYKAKNLSRALATFKKLREAGTGPDIFDYTVMMSAYNDSSEENVAEACEVLFQEMISKNVKPNDRTYFALIKARNRQPELAEAHFEAMQRAGYTGKRMTPHACSTLMHSYVEAKRYHDGLRIYKFYLETGHPLGPVILDLALRAIVGAEDVEALKTLLSELEQNGHVPELDGAYMIIEACSKLFPDMQLAMENFQKYFQGSPPLLQPVPKVYRALMAGFAKRGDLNSCMDILEILSKLDSSRDDPIYLKLLMLAYGRAGNHAKAKEIWIKLGQANAINATVANNALDSAGHNGTIDDVEDIIAECETLGVVFDENAYNSWIEALCRLRYFDRAINVFHDMLAKGIDPTPKTYRTIITPLKKELMWEEVGQIHDIFTRHYPALVLEAEKYLNQNF